MIGNLGVRVDCMEGVQVDYMGGIDGAIDIGVSWAAMTRCGQVGNSVVDTGVAAAALCMYNMRTYHVIIAVIFGFLLARFDSQLGGQYTISR